MGILRKLAAILLVFSFLEPVEPKPRHYDAIFNFGDSISDTGNFLLTGAKAFPVVKYLPYGETFFHHPTGRCSDGRLIVDFFAEAFGVPYLKPYLARLPFEASRNGVNFAVAGATAIPSKYFYEQNVALWTNDSLSVQLSWFKKIKPSLCATKHECTKLFKKSLFLVGEIGGNDYNYLFLGGGSILQLQPLVPVVVETIVNAIKILIHKGAVELLVPGNLPFGCAPVYLSVLGSTNKTDYDAYGCLKAFNAFSEYHNKLLQLALEQLRHAHPHVKIIYADYYNAALPLYHHPHRFGFKKTLRACCGSGRYNFNFSAVCGAPGSEICTDPSTYVSWDGIHFTEAAHRQIATHLLTAM